MVEVNDDGGVGDPMPRELLGGQVLYEIAEGASETLTVREVRHRSVGLGLGCADRLFAGATVASGLVVRVTVEMGAAWGGEGF